MLRHTWEPLKFGHVRTYYVYILANPSRLLYVGVSNDLRRRVWQHRYACGSRFTSRYRIRKLVHFEAFADVRAAIAREKDLKRRHHAYKVRLIERNNPDWLDLAAYWFDCSADELATERASPSTVS